MGRMAETTSQLFVYFFRRIPGPLCVVHTPGHLLHLHPQQHHPTEVRGQTPHNIPKILTTVGPEPIVIYGVMGPLINGRKWMGNWCYYPMGVWSLTVFCCCFPDFQAVCKSDGWIPKNRNKHKNHRLPRSIYAQTGCFHVAKLVKSWAIFLRWWFFITHLKTTVKTGSFLPKKVLWNKTTMKLWPRNLQVVWVDSADDTRNSENQHSEALHFCRPGNYQEWNGHR